jgi:uncharacterized protein with HEPN domain
MEKEPNVFVGHILMCIENIKNYTQGIDQEHFFLNRLVQDAVIRNLEIIGEATKNIPQHFPNKYLHIPWKQMAGMRDILIHDYMKADIEAVWTTIEEHLPSLKIDYKRSKIRKRLRTDFLQQIIFSSQLKIPSEV